MGLAASQARLLFITSRQSDVENRMMTISNQKMALARNLEEISDDYTNALNTRKLVWDNDALTSGNEVDLTYGLLMSYNSGMSAMPYLITNTAGAVVLDEKYASIIGATNGAAQTLGEHISEADFIEKLTGNKPSEQTTLQENGNNETGILETTKLSTNLLQAGIGNEYYANDSLQDLYDKNVSIGLGIFDGRDGIKNSITVKQNLEDLLKLIASCIPDADSTALNKAIEETLNQFINGEKEWQKQATAEGAQENANEEAYRINGISHARKENSHDHYTSVNIKNLMDAFMTNYAENKNVPNAANLLVNGIRNLLDKIKDINNPQTSMILSNYTTEEANYYAYLYRAINAKGWTTDSNVSNQDAFEFGLRNGKYFIQQYSSKTDSYEGNDTYANINEIRDVTDDEAAAKAEVIYENEKTKLNNKESRLDIDLKRCETKRTSLVTEYDSVKALLDKNIERSFKLFQNG